MAEEGRIPRRAEAAARGDVDVVVTRLDLDLDGSESVVRLALVVEVKEMAVLLRGDDKPV